MSVQSMNRPYLPGKELAGEPRTQQDLCSQQTIGGTRGTAPYNHNIGHTRDHSLSPGKENMYILQKYMSRGEQSEGYFPAKDPIKSWH